MLSRHAVIRSVPWTVPSAKVWKRAREDVPGTQNNQRPSRINIDETSHEDQVMVSVEVTNSQFRPPQSVALETFSTKACKDIGF